MNYLEKVIEDLERIRGIKPLKRFMVVEDDESDAAFMKLILSQRGAMVEVHPTADKAIKVLQCSELCQGVCYSRIFLDLSFPAGGQGTDVLEYLKAQSENIPVVIVSGLYDEHLRMKLNELGCDYISKQQPPELFRKELEKYL